MNKETSYLKFIQSSLFLSFLYAKKKLFIKQKKKQNYLLI